MKIHIPKDWLIKPFGKKDIQDERNSTANTVQYAELMDWVDAINREPNGNNHSIDTTPKNGVKYRKKQ